MRAERQRRTDPAFSRALLFFFILPLLLTGVVSAGEQEEIADPCAGPFSLLALLDRPTVSDSACAVPSGGVVLETGFQSISLRSPGGTAESYPQAELRIGLPGGNELVLLPSSYTRQRAGSPAQETSGFSAVTAGLKHELGYTGRWLGAVEALITLPSGGQAFGSSGLGVAANAIVSYALSDDVGLSLQLGISSQTTSELDGGRRYTSLVSNIVATWQPEERLQLYGEIYGQTSTGPGEGAGYNADFGIQYLITPSWEVDLEEGVRLSGNLGGLSNYLAFGMGFRF